MASGSKTSVVSAIIGNSLVMVSKVIGFFLTGSSSMLAESIHSFADVMNQWLLLFGITKSEQAPDAHHARGYGRERFVWALISAVGIFFIGCGVTVYHGIEKLIHPSEHTQFTSSEYMYALAILIFSLLVEGYVLWVAYKSIKKDSQGKPFWPYVFREADSSVVAVLMEDAAACLGIIIAFLALALTQITGQGYWDAIGSILVGILLGWIAVWLAHRNRALLIGQSIPQKDLDTLMNVLHQSEFIEEVDFIHTEVIGVDQYEAQIEADFDENLLVKSVQIDLKEAYKSIQSEEEFIAFCEKYGALCIEHVKEKIDELEAEIKSKVPQVDYIDIEPN